jgi:hypothetical protein
MRTIDNVFENLHDFEIEPDENSWTQIRNKLEKGSSSTIWYQTAAGLFLVGLFAYFITSKTNISELKDNTLATIQIEHQLITPQAGNTVPGIDLTAFRTEKNNTKLHPVKPLPAEAERMEISAYEIQSLRAHLIRDELVPLELNPGKTIKHEQVTITYLADNDKTKDKNLIQKIAEKASYFKNSEPLFSSIREARNNLFSDKNN